MIFVTKNTQSQVLAIINANGRVMSYADTISVCQGSSIVYTSLAQNATSIHWRFNNPPPSSSSASSVSITYNTVGIDSTILIANGNSGTIDSTFIYVRVSNTFPTVNFDLLPNNPVCGDSVINFINLSSGGGLTNYLWDFADGTTSSAFNPFHTFLSAVGTSGTQTFLVKLEVINNLGCKGSITKPVTVLRVPDANIGNGSSPDVDSILFNGLTTFKRCAADNNYTFIFKNASTTSTLNTEYTFIWGDASAPTTIISWPANGTISHNYVQGNYRLRVKVKGGVNGCTGIRDYNVFLGTTPTGTIGLPLQNYICVGDTFKFPIFGINNNTPGTTYTFSFLSDGSLPITYLDNPPNPISHVPLISSCGQPSNSFKVQFDIKNACSNLSASGITLTSIFASGKPKADMRILPSNIICTNSNITLQNTSLYGDVVAEQNNSCSNIGKQVWEITPSSGYNIVTGSPGNFTGPITSHNNWNSGSNSLVLNFTVAGTYYVKLYVSNSKCGLDTITRTICVRNPPQASFTMSGRTACNTGTTTITNTSPVGTCGGDTYNWTVTHLDPLACGSGSSFSFINGTNATSANPQFQFNAPGEYVVTLTVSAINAPVLSCPVAIAKDTFTVKGKPKVVINPISAVCVGNGVNPTATVSACYSTSPLIYSWTFPNGSPISSNNAIPGVINYTNTGNYWAILEVANECGSSLDSELVVITPPPVANAGPDKEICSGAGVVIGTTAVTGLTYQWMPSTGLSNAGAATPTVTNVYIGPAVDSIHEYILTVSAGANCQSRDTVLVKVKKRPDVTVTAVPTVICAGDSVVLTAVGASGYSWFPSTGLSAVSGNPVIARPDTTTTYSVVGTENGCTDTAQTTITVNNFAIVSAGPDTIICNNISAVQLVGSPANGTWSGNSNITTTGVFNPQAAGNGTYTLYYTYGSNNCIRTDSVLVSVANPPVAFAGNDTTICQSGSGLTLVGTPAGGTWSGSTQVSSNGQLNTSVAGVFTLIYTVGSGSCIGRDTTVVNVGGGVANNVIAPNQSICFNTQPAVIVGQAATGGNGTPTYVWQQSTDNINWVDIVPAQTSLNYTPPVLMVTTYYRRVATTALCGGAQGSFSQPVTITVNPNARALFAATDTLKCAPFNLTSVITVTPFTGRNATYQWYANGVLFGSNTTGVFPGYIINTPGQTVIIKLVTTSAFGCQPDSMEKTFITTTGVTAGFTKDRSAGCDTLKVTFNNTSVPISNTFQYIWNFGNGITSIAQQPGTINYLSSPNNVDTTYYVSLKAYNGCDTTYWRDSVQVRANPKARFSVDTTFGCSPFTVHIINSSKGGPSVYYWDFGNGTTDTTNTLTSFSVTYNTGVTDTFTIRLIAENECKRDTSFINVVVAPNTIQPQVSINGNQLYSCVPASIIFNNTTTGANNFVWNFGDGSAPLNTTQQQTLVPHIYNAAGQYTVSIRMRNGCSDTTVFRQIEVFARPDANFTTNATAFCAGDTVRVNNLSTNANAYRWDWGDGTTAVGNNPFHVYATGGNYIITLSADRVINQGIVCTDTAQRAVTVINKPVANISSNITALNCAPFTLQVAAVGLGNETANWYFKDTTVLPNIITATGATAQYTFNKPGTFSIQLVVINNAGCRDSLPLSFTVNGTPNAAFAPVNLSTCKTDTLVAYTNTTTYGGIDPLQYRWWVDGQLIASSSNFSYQYLLGTSLPPRSFNTLLIVSNQAGCRDTATGVLTMQAAPQSLFSLVNPNTCVPFGLQVSNTSLNATNYQWLVNGVVVSTQANPVLPITQVATSYTITLITNNVFGCKPDTLTRTFTSLARPKAIFTLNDTLSCTGSLNVVPVNQSTGATGYTWIWGDGTANSNLPNTTHLYTLPGQYALTLIATDGVCSDTASKFVRVARKPLVDFNANQSVFCGNDSVKFINLTTLANNYLWDFGDGTFSTQINPVHFFAQRNTPYTVKLVATGTFGCKDSAVKANLILAKPLPGASFAVSPSPVINVPNYTFNFINTTLQNNNHSYYWTFGDGSLPATSRNATHLYKDTGNYTIKLAIFDQASNCTDTAIKVVRITGFPGYLYVPNAFEPGSLQPILKTFLPLGRGLHKYRLQIFTTWGQKVFETTSLDASGAPVEGWNGMYNGRDIYNQGKMVQQDVYIWRIDAYFLNGSEWKGMIYPGKTEPTRVGTITVIR